MYQAINPQVVYDLTDYVVDLGGEVKVDLTSSVKGVELSVYYENEELNLLCKIVWLFEGVRFCKMDNVPGVDLMNIKYEYPDKLYSLFEFKNSDACGKWEQQLNRISKLHHYKIFFLNENKSFEVICKHLIFGGTFHEKLH